MYTDEYRLQPVCTSIKTGIGSGMGRSVSVGIGAVSALKKSCLLVRLLLISNST